MNSNKEELPMTPKLLQDKEGQLRTRREFQRKEILRLRHDEDNIRQSIAILRQRLTSYHSQIEAAQDDYHSTDRQLAYLDGRYQKIKAKKCQSRTRKVKPEPSLKDLSKDQLAYLQNALEKLMEGK
jgi:predicted  nucleic acid-binding Zn-ribbon protein